MLQRLILREMQLHLIEKQLFSSSLYRINSYLENTPYTANDLITITAFFSEQRLTL